MLVPVTLPDVRLDAGTDMRVSIWFLNVGDELFEGDRLVEILAGAVTFDVPSPCDGRLSEIRVAEEDSVSSGEVLAFVELED